MTETQQPITPSQATSPSVIQLSGPWRLSFLESVPSIKRTYKLNLLQTWEGIDDSTRILMGTGVYTTTFRMEKSDVTGPWNLELSDVRESARVYLNGHLLGCAWAVPFTLPCGNALRAGKNELRIEVTNLPANRIADMDRRGVVWRMMKDINVVDLNYRPTSYAQWTPMPSGLNGPVRLVKP